MRAQAMVAVVATLAVAMPAVSEAQFHVSLPAAWSAGRTCASKVAERAKWDRCILSNADSVRTILFERLPARIRTSLAAPGGHDPATVTSQLASDTSAVKNVFRGGLQRDQLVKGPFSGDDVPIRRLYGAEGAQSFSDIGGTATHSTVYLSTSVISGILGRTRFELSAAKVVSSADDSVPAAERMALEDGTANVLRLINNGGSTTARLIYPFWVGGGTVSKHSVGVVVNAGAIGPLDDESKLKPALGAAIEGLMTGAIRNADTYEPEGELLLGLRLGYQGTFADSVISPLSTDRGFPYLQVLVGVRKGDKMQVGFVYTRVRDTYRDFVPKLQFMITAPKF